ncbi:uncharacterized protein LOC132556835 [Ylistrum balloti]|uniref:uncharacterized protein LOC132556835 n=1 Tax=Ylistrum balloti TaxID=509963 RepID=UPI002905B5DE|nr:uncharacterized protein LOC132556835 [Ylistrum balloti]
MDHLEVQVRQEIADKFLSLANRLENDRVQNIDGELERTIDILNQFSAIASVDISEVLELAARALYDLREHDDHGQDQHQSSTYTACTIITLERCQGKSGAPYYKIPYETLVSLLKYNFKLTDIASMLGVSVKTIRRRMSEYGLPSIRSKYSAMTCVELEEEVRKIIDEFPNVGYKTIASILQSKGHIVQQSKVRDLVRKVDPQGTLLRRMFLSSHRLQRRSYSVRAPLALWHIDNHKLIRWRFVIHGGIDGYSRLPVFLQVNTNNCAETVLAAFLHAVQEYGTPEKVRTDKGGENVKVAEYMVTQKGPKSFIAGRSVHNQRIERFWRELWPGVVTLYYQIFHHMEIESVLDPDDETHLLALHLVFKSRIQQHLDVFRDSFCRRPIRTEGNQTPLQLWIRGQILDPSWYPQSENDQLNFGIDYDGPVPDHVDPDCVEIPPTPTFPIMEEHHQTISEITHRNSLCFGIDLFQEMVQLLRSFQ